MRMKWLFLVILLFGSRAALGSDLPLAFTQGLMALEINDCRAALQAFAAIPDPPPESIGRRVRFLTGYCLLQTDRPAEALPLLERSAAEDDLLADYALAYAAEAALAAEDKQQATLLLSRLLARYPTSRLAEDAEFRLATTYVDMEQHENAEKALSTFLDRHGSSSHAPEATRLLAKVYLTLERPADAVPLLKRLYIHFPTDPAAAEAERLLQEIPERPALTPAEQFQRAEALFLEGKYTQAAPILTLLLKNDPHDTEVRLLLGRSLFGTKEYPRAIAVLLPLTDRTVQGSVRIQALFLVGRASLRSGKHFQAIAFLERIPNTFPQSGLADDALVLIGLNHEDRGKVDQALKVYERVLRRYPRGDLGDTARWRRAWLLYRQNKLQRAAQELQHLVKDYPQSPQRAQALYWHGRFSEEMGNHARAKEIYRQLVKDAILDPYYEWRARERLQLKPERFASGPPPPVDDRSSQPLAKARELFFLRMWRDAAAEYWELATAEPHEISLQWEACQALSRANEFEKVLSIARRSVFTLLATGRKDEAVTMFWSFLYPRGFWPSVDHSVQETSLDPYLVAAVIREESAFSPTAVSRAGAKGLMQLMPATAARMARETGLPSSPDLDAPGPNIALGTRYLAKLQEEFEGNLVLTVAAYNAGPQAVQRWLKDNHPSKDLDTFVEEIPYPETQGYVKRVLGSYDRYRVLYAQPERAVEPTQAQ